MTRAHPRDELLRYLVVEFRDHGQRAVEFLATARELVEGGLWRSVRETELLAYALREALKTIPASQASGDGGEWKKISRRVTTARQRYERESSGLPGSDPGAALADLLSTISELDEFHNSEGLHQKRLIALVVERAGTLPYESGNQIIDEYKKLLSELDDSLHGSVTQPRALELYDAGVDLLHRLFLPPEDRHADLEALAALSDPTTDDLQTLKRLVVTSQNMQRFLAHLVGPKWLELLVGTTFLDPPDGQAGWPGYAAIDALHPAHTRELVAWLTAMYDRCGSSPAQAWAIVRAAADLGPDAYPLLVCAIRDHTGFAPIRQLGSWVLNDRDPAEQIVQDLADVLLNSHEDDPWMLGRTATQLVDGITETNALDRLTIIAFKIKAADREQHGWRWYVMDSSGSIAERDLQRREDHFDVLLAAFVAAARKVVELLGTAASLPLVETLPVEVRGRMRAWLLGADPTTPLTALAREVATAIQERDPTGDDLPLIDRVAVGLQPEDYLDLWTAALGTPPTIESAGEALREREPDAGCLRAYHWLGLVPEAAQGPWADVYALMCGAYGTPRRAALEHRVSTITTSWGRSPYTTEELAGMEPIEAAKAVAAWRPDVTQFGGGSRELARALQAVIEADPVRWLARPYQLATTLREPIYINHLLNGAAKAIGNFEDPQVEELMKVVALVRSRPWEPNALGSSDWDFDPDWNQANQAAIALLRALADTNTGYAGDDDVTWETLKAAALNRTDSSGLPDETEPLSAAINRPCTRALEAVVSFMNHEHHTVGRPRAEAMELLDGVLRLEGFDGAQHRAIIASRLGFFLTIVPDWVEANADTLFGADAPDDLGQVTVDLALQWSRTSRWLLERFPTQVRDAVSRDVDNALTHILIGNLWGVPGYSSDELLRNLSSVPGLLSKAGEALGRLARNADEASLPVAVALWAAAVNLNANQDLGGFGWFAEVKTMDDPEWADLTLRTLQASGARIDWANGVGERAAAMEPSITTMAILDDLVRHAGEDWDRRRSAELAVEHLGRAGTLSATPEYQRLRNTLAERGLL